jgi:dienelactone hydrolase
VTAKRRIVQTIESERVVPGGRELHLGFRLGEGESIPAILSVPSTGGRVPAVLLVHGMWSKKEELAGPMGRPLLARGLATLAIDLPLHGRRSDPKLAQSARNPLSILQLWRHSLTDVRLALQYLAARAETDTARLGIVGYSLGSFLSIAAASEEPRVRAVVLAAGGDLPEGTSLTTMARMAADPVRAIRKLKGRPLLMVHGRHDRTVTPDQAERLFAAAGEPKELRWYEAGHRLPASASDDVADWLAARLGGGAARDAV